MKHKIKAFSIIGLLVIALASVVYAGVLMPPALVQNYTKHHFTAALYLADTTSTSVKVIGPGTFPAEITDNVTSVVIAGQETLDGMSNMVRLNNGALVLVSLSANIIVVTDQQ